jgi:transposase
MRRDGRGFDHRTLESIRLMAVERVRDGERPSCVITSFGFNRTTIYRWLDAASKPGVGLNALRSRPVTGRPRRLTPRQERRVFGWVNGRDPRQYGLDFGLWTRSLVAELIERKFGIRLGVTAVGELLARLGLTPQKTAATGVSTRNGGANGSRRLPGRRKHPAARSISGMSPGFAPMP